MGFTYYMQYFILHTLDHTYSFIRQYSAEIILTNAISTLSNNVQIVSTENKQGELAYPILNA